MATEKDDDLVEVWVDMDLTLEEGIRTLCIFCPAPSGCSCPRKRHGLCQYIHGKYGAKAYEEATRAYIEKHNLTGMSMEELSYGIEDGCLYSVFPAIKEEKPEERRAVAPKNAQRNGFVE